MKLTFSGEASSNYFTLHCLPLEGHGQRIEKLSYSVTPSSYLAEGMDGLGNPYLYGGVLSPHASLTVKVEGTVSVGMEREKAEDLQLQYLYRRETLLTKPGKSLLALHESLGASSDIPNYVAACLQRIKEEVTYQKGLTGPATTAEEALVLHHGVCQDYAHILLSLLRRKGIAARYAAGLVVGEGETHAWVEVLTPSGWVGYDPTNGKKVDDTYLIFSTGADASDCLVNKGVIRLNGTQSLKANAKMEILEQ